MDGPSPVDAFERISARAEDLRDAFRPGGIPLHGDVTAAPRVLRSSDPLSVVLPPGAWLVTSAADGTRAYTRDGALTVADGTVRTRDGAAVLGFAGGDARGSIAAPLQLPAADRALGRCDDAGIEADIQHDEVPGPVHKGDLAADAGHLAGLGSVDGVGQISDLGLGRLQ